MFQSGSEGRAAQQCAVLTRLLSPLLANIALSVLDEHFHAKWKALGPEWRRVKHRPAGGPVMKLLHYADDFVIMVHGQQSDAEALWGAVAAVLRPMGLRLSEAKTRLTHIDTGFDFLGWRIQRRRKKGHQGRETLCLHLPVEEVTGFDHRQGATADPAGISSHTR